MTPDITLSPYCISKDTYKTTLCFIYRLSSFASKQLTEGNPDFTDLSDSNRPVKMAERFHKIYDDEWTTSLESLTHAKKGSICLAEEEAISLLMDIIKV